MNLCINGPLDICLCNSINDQVDQPKCRHFLPYSKDVLTPCRFAKEYGNDWECTHPLANQEAEED